MSTRTRPPRAVIPSKAACSGRIGFYRRYEPDNEQGIAEARRDLRAATIADAIQKNLDGAPPLTPAQIDELRTLLSTSANDSGLGTPSREW